jgi:O-acetyl-ADP-ribose deacetylase (regulator of RNase III)
MVIEISGNILDIENGIICHQVNCQRVAGKGLALQIRKKYSDWYDKFKDTTLNLGDIMVHIPTGYPRLFIASLYSQDRYGTEKVHTDYRAFESCLEKINYIFSGSNICIYFPYKIGCGLAGGDWKIVKKTIQDIIPSAFIVRR